MAESEEELGYDMEGLELNSVYEDASKEELLEALKDAQADVVLKDLRIDEFVEKVERLEKRLQNYEGSNKAAHDEMIARVYTSDFALRYDWVDTNSKDYKSLEQHFRAVADKMNARGRQDRLGNIESDIRTGLRRMRALDEQLKTKHIEQHIFEALYDEKYGVDEEVAGVQAEIDAEKIAFQKKMDELNQKKEDAKKGGKVKKNEPKTPKRTRIIEDDE